MHECAYGTLAQDLSLTLVSVERELLGQPSALAVSQESFASSWTRVLGASRQKQSLWRTETWNGERG